MFVALLLSWMVIDFAHAGPRFERVVHIVFENADLEDAMAQPEFARLARAGAWLQDFRGVTHPSQPNYIAMIAGSTMGVRLDGNVDLEGRHLGDLLRERGMTWKAYAQGYPGNCYLGKRLGNYVRKHVPFLSFKSVQNDPQECARVVPAERFFEDVRRGELPEYSMFIPDLVDDGHDTDAAHAARWFGANFGAVLADSALVRKTLFVVTYDESRSYIGSNRIYTVLFGANVVPGSRMTSRADHYSVLRMIQEGFGLGSLGKEDTRAPAIQGIWAEPTFRQVHGIRNEIE
jgi:hypothetical protein